jgi:tRNA 2-selenouridine synthase
VLRAAAVSPRPILQLAGGTKAYRREILKDISSPAFYPPLLVLSGNTGSGKSRLIEHLETRGFPVLHLEACAQHMSSAFGNIPYLRAPWHGTQTQKRFEHAIHSSLEEAKRRMALKGFHSVITEAESRKVGGVTLPPVLNHAIRTAPHVSIEGVMNLRVKILREDYFYSSETCLPLLRERLGSIRGRMQGALYARLQEHLDAGAAEPFFRLILEEYYDRIYHRVDHAPLATFRVGTLDELFETGENLLTKILHD